MKFRRIRRSAIGAGIVALALAVALPPVIWAFQNWRVVEFTPACREYEEPAEGSLVAFKDLEFRSGEPTREFWRLATARARDLAFWRLSSAENTEFYNGKIYTTWSEYFNFSVEMKKFEREREEWFYEISKWAAQRTFERRQAEGAFEGVDMTPFKVRRWRSKTVELRHPDECGFMEELIMKGGRFAAE